MIAHRSNIAEVAGVRLAEGEAVVVRPIADGFSIVGTLKPGDG